MDLTHKVRLVRHQDKRYDVARLYRSKQLEIYQSIQGKPVFGDAQTLISFIGQPGTNALFVGVYHVRGISGPRKFVMPIGFIYPQMDTTNCYHYDLDHDPRFNDLQGRLVIDWGGATRSWVQHFKPRPVVEILPKGYVSAFPGYMETLVTHAELSDIINHPLPHRDWHQMLKAVAGIYLVLDTRTGSQYVGSAYGATGLLGRWRTYVETGHGGNRQLRQLFEDRPNAAGDLQFSILQTLPSTLTAKEVIAHESLHKQKLGTRAHGLNSN